MTSDLARRLRSGSRRALLAWLAVELSAGIIALILLVALLPAAVVLLAHPLRPAVALVGVLSVSFPLAALLGVSAIRLAKGVATTR